MNRLNIHRDKEQCLALEIARAPRWTAIEDNAAGYDILSYVAGTVEPTSRLIEVKGSRPGHYLFFEPFDIFRSTH